MTQAPIIEVQGLTWGYPHASQPIFSNLHLSIEKHDFVFIVGESGVGKTTLVKFLIRQLQPPVRSIFHQKEDIARLSGAEVQAYRRTIGVVHQDFKLIEWKNVWQNIAYPLQIMGIDGDIIAKRVDQLLHQFGLEERAHAHINQLSGGEKQRVAIARALTNHPQFIIADEPTGNLDWRSTKVIGDTLIDINNKGNTVVVITHDQHLIQHVQRKHQIKIIELSGT